MTETPPLPNTHASDEPSGPPAGDPRVAALADAVQRLARSHQELADAVGPRAAADPGRGPASADDMRRVVLDVLREQDAARRRTDGRDRYVRAKLGDLPDAYRRLMPDTDDDRALAAAERDVRRQFRDDLRTLGGAGTDVAGDPVPAGGHRPGAAVDYAALSPLQQIALGLKTAPTATAERVPAPTRRASTGARQSAPDPDTAFFFHGAD